MRRSRRRFRRRRTTLAPATLEPLVYLWILRILVPLDGCRKLIDSHGFSDDALAEAIGLGHWMDDEGGMDDEGDSFNERAVRRELLEIYKRKIEELGNARASGYLERNIKRLSKLAGLRGVDERILEFALLVYDNHLLESAVDLLDDRLSSSATEVPRTLAVILDLPEAEIRSALDVQGVLRQSGLLRGGTLSSIGDTLEVISRRFAGGMLSSDEDPINFLDDCVTPGKSPTLSLKDYSHFSRELAVLKPYLASALKEKLKGVNIFIHGPPGTGKTELALSLAKHLRCPLFEVTGEDEDGDPIQGGKRLCASRLAQYFLARGRHLILFDEAEDVLSDGGLLQFSSTKSNKAWTNRMLEENQVPVLWLSNDSRDIDPAFIRRFKMAFELPPPPTGKRRQIIRRECRDILAPSHIERLATSSDLSPAVVAQTAKVVRNIRESLGKEEAARAFDMIVNNTLELQGHEAVKQFAPNRLPEIYDPVFINADCDMGELARGLDGSEAGRLCLYGPPGTGKTAYGRWLARQLDAPLLLKRGSDLMSMWVGGTEAKIARAFAEAEREGAVLMIDEVEGFLQDRRGAQHSWEVTAVNEMLTQMESFGGVFVASTNLVEGLDQASLRRFDLKIKFDYLLSEQAWGLFRKHCKQLGLPSRHPVGLEAELKRLRELTPGDFAAVARRHRFQPITSAQGLARALARECEMKGGGKRPIGFHG